MKRLFAIVIVLSVFYSCTENVENNSVPVSRNTKKVDTIINFIPEVIVDTLSQKLFENSALVLWNGMYWTINDSGGLPEVYGINHDGKIEQIVNISNALNNDWEDLTIDENFMYIGDFGNNGGGRKNLCVLKIPLKDILQREPGITPEIISFSYTDQNRFDYEWTTSPYDCESIANFNDSLFLFAKDWQDQKTRVYFLSKEPGKYDIQPIDSFNADGLVTGADAHNGKLALCGYKNYVPFVWIFWNFQNSDFFSGNKIRINLPDFLSAQIEGITFLNDSVIILSNENSGFPHSLIKVSLSGLGYFSE